MGAISRTNEKIDMDNTSHKGYSIQSKSQQHYTPPPPEAS